MYFLIIEDYMRILFIGVVGFIGGVIGV